MDKKCITTIVVVALLVGAVSFYGGMKFAGGKKTADFQPGNFSGRGMMQGEQKNSRQIGNQQARNGGLVRGEVLSQTQDQITVKTNGGGSKIILIPGSMDIMTSVKASSTDITVGANVMISGTTNNDGSITAQSLQIIPNELSVSPEGQTLGAGAKTPPTE